MSPVQWNTLVVFDVVVGLCGTDALSDNLASDYEAMAHLLQQIAEQSKQPLYRIRRPDSTDCSEFGTIVAVTLVLHCFVSSSYVCRRYGLRVWPACADAVTDRNAYKHANRNSCVACWLWCVHGHNFY